MVDTKVIKRDCSCVDFNKEKIRIAIEKAMKNGSCIYEPKIAEAISNDIEKDVLDKVEISIYKIEEMVFSKLIEYGQKETARAYENYRTVREMQRKENTTDGSIEGLIKRTNREVLKENSNKSANVACTQRDLIAGEVSKDMAKRRLVPAHLVQAHEDRMIHLHDLDYLIQPIFNCFSGDTEFVTNLGVLKFRDCNDGQIVEVIDKDGKWREATVRKYAKDRLQTITITSGRTEKRIRATKNHRWILKNGEVTTNLKVGDRLYLLNETELDMENINNDLFCFGFVLGDGNEYINQSNSHDLKVRLCGKKTKHLPRFIKAGYKVSKQKFENGDVAVVKTTELSKRDFIDNKCWKYLSKNDKISLFLGYYAADGYKDINGIATADKNLAEMTRDISSVAGYHIISEKFEIRDTPFKKDAQLYTFRFIKKQETKKNWIVKDINRDDLHDYDVWCVEEPITKTFTLANGIVTGNCALLSLDDMLDNGTVINEKRVNSPSCFATACTIATQIMAQVASNQYGGQSITIAHLAPYLRKSYYKYLNLFNDYENKEEIAERLTKKELRDGVQTIRYQLSTLQTSNGQSPFATIYLEVREGDEYEKEMAVICEEMIRQRLEGMQNYKGQPIGEAFPKLIYLLDENNYKPGTKYWYLTKLSAECSAKRLVPDYQSAKIMRQNYGDTFAPMGCRSHLSPYKDKNGNLKWYGRFNQGVVSINLPQIGIIANGDMNKFWKIFDARLELCKEALLLRHHLLEGTKADTSPIHWMYGAIARLDKDDVIDPLLHNGYSTLSLGYVGIYELVQAMLGVSHTTPEGEKFALEVMQYMHDKCELWKKETDGLGFSLYGTPRENTVYRFCNYDREKYGIIPNVTDNLYYTNSYHVNVKEEIDAFSKLKFESQFHSISSGGCISYIEVPDMSRNLEAVEQLITFIYDNIQYAEINSRPDICYKCGFTGEIKLDENLEWYCPSCGNRDEKEMQVMRRTCGLTY